MAIKFKEWINENEEPAAPKFKVGDKVHFTGRPGSAVYEPVMVKVPRTRTGGTMLDGKRVSNSSDFKETTFIVDKVAIRDEEFRKSEVFGKYEKYVYFLKDGEKTYLLGESDLISTEHKSKTEERAKLICMYFADLFGAEFIELNKVTGKDDDQAVFTSYSLYSTSHRGKSNSSMGGSAFYNKKVAEAAVEYMNKLTNESVDFVVWKMSSDRHTYTYISKLLEHIKEKQPDFKESDLQNVRGLKMAKELDL